MQAAGDFINAPNINIAIGTYAPKNLSPKKSKIASFPKITISSPNRNAKVNEILKYLSAVAVLFSKALPSTNFGNNTVDIEVCMSA